jgi:hypothetical protein
LLITQFLFFPWVEVGVSRGLCCSGPGLSVGVPRYHKAHLVCIFPSHLGAGNWRPRGPPRCPFNVKWRFSALAAGVEGSKLCLFSVIMPTKCVFSVSPRFHYRRLAFCFLPLDAILESPPPDFLTKVPKAYDGEKTACSKIISGKIRYLPAEN